MMNNKIQFVNCEYIFGPGTVVIHMNIGKWLKIIVLHHFITMKDGKHKLLFQIFLPNKYPLFISKLLSFMMKRFFFIQVKFYSYEFNIFTDLS